MISPGSKPPQAFGPYRTEGDTYREPLHVAWTALNQGPVRSRDLKLDHLRQACADAGVELGAYDDRILTWLAGYEPSVVQVFIGLISRAYAAGLVQGGEQS
jgi:hypothetical protein